MRTLVISWFFPPNTGGAATVMYNLCKFLPKSDYVILTASSDWNILGRVHDLHFALDCYSIYLPVHNHALGSFRFSLSVFIRGLLLNKKEGCDCLLAVYPDIFDLLGAYFLHVVIRKPLVVYMHDLFSENITNSLLRTLWGLVEKVIFSASHVVLVTNEKFKKHYEDRLIFNTKVFPHSIELRPEKKLDQIKKAKTGKTRIVFTGTVSEAQEDAVFALIEATKDADNLEVIFATPSEKDYLKGVSVGYLSKEGCRKLQATADILFVPLALKYRNPDETRIAFPTKILEYLMAGKPILAMAPRGSYVEDFINRNEVGIVVTEGSKEDIVGAVRKLANKGNKRKFSRNGLKTVQHFDARLRSKELHSLLAGIVNESRKKNRRF
ncbi:glycosyltransferase [Candidatus Bathyarchaeota archaeon]|nr:glycosyltransferase [Candidatus Bathyarchaeota archaeon]